MKSAQQLTLWLASLGLAMFANTASSSVVIGFTATEAQFEDSSGTALSNGSIVSVGYFNLSGAFSFAQIGTPAFDSYAEVSPYFTSYGSASTETLAYSAPYNRAGSIDTGNGSGIAPDGDAGKALYMWAFNSSSVATATEWAIVSNLTTTPGGKWIVPTTPFSTDIDLGGDVSTRVVNFGAVSSNTGSGGVGVYDIKTMAISAVPEPSSFLALAGLGLFGFVSRRVRRSSVKA